MAPSTNSWLGAEWEVGAREQESGQIVIDKSRHWKPLQLTLWMNAFADFWYKHIHGDKDTFHLAWRSLGASFTMCPCLKNMGNAVMVQHDTDGRPIFQHRNMAKWRLNGDNRKIPGYEGHELALESLARFKRKVLEGGPLIP